MAFMDNIFVQIVIMAVAIFAVVKGGDIFVDSASWMAEATGIPKLIVGATVVSIATTLPELLVSAIAAFKGSGDMAIGNAVGSVTANTGMIMALSLLCMPSVIERKDYLLKSLLMVGAGAVLLTFGFVGELNAVGCVILLIICAVAWTESIRNASKAVALTNMDRAEQHREKIEGKVIVKNVGLFVVGAAAIAIGAHFMVSSGQYIAEFIHIPERIIAVTVIAIGTSLPELVTTLTAIRKKEMSLSVGNIIGANIQDLTLILPICSLISGAKGGELVFTSIISGLDLPIMFITGVIGVVPMLITKKFSRWQGVLLLVVYVIYVVFSSSTGLQALLPWVTVGA